MNMSDKNNLEVNKESEEPLTYNHPGMAGEWQFNDSNFGNSSIGIVLNVNGMVVGGDGVGPSCSSSGVMVDSFGSAVWDHPVDSVSLGFNEMNVQSGGASASDPLSMLKGSMFLPNVSGMFPDSLSQFPADSAFIERAARFSSFSGGHFGQLLNPYGLQQPVNPYLHGGPVMQGPQDPLSGNAIKMLPSRQPQNRDARVGENSKDVSVPPKLGAVEVDSPMKERSHGEAKQGVSVSGNASDEQQNSGGGTREDSSPLSAKGLGAKKRRRNNRDVESDQANGVQQQSGEAGKRISRTQQKGEPISAPTVNKSNGKQRSQNSDPPKDDYIHVRARRGQATNSHSLAERVRREKISERMKFLQDLVPGCSKVTGKAVMLDEIINYVQSLQRQVEFLSMKLATVNPRLDSNIEQLLIKDHVFSRSGPSGIGISPTMPMSYPPLHTSQPPILQPDHPGIANCSDLLRRTITSHLTNMGGGYIEPTHQLPNQWEDEMHNVVQTGFNSPLDSQETNCGAAQGPMKAEP